MKQKIETSFNPILYHNHNLELKMSITTSPSFYQLMYNIIDCSITIKQSKLIIKKKYPELLPYTTDDVIERHARLYHLIKKLQRTNFYDFISKKIIIYNCNDCNKEYLMHIVYGWTRCEECAKHYHDEDSECEECEDQDNFTNRMCENENCKKEFDVSEPHYYDEENGVCYCCEDCYCLCEKTTN